MWPVSEKWGPSAAGSRHTARAGNAVCGQESRRGRDSGRERKLMKWKQASLLLMTVRDREQERGIADSSGGGSGPGGLAEQRRRRRKQRQRW